MSNLKSLSTPLASIKPLIVNIKDIYLSLLESKHKTTTRKTYQTNLSQFAYYLTEGVIAKGETITISPEIISDVLNQFINLNKTQAVTYFAHYQSALIEAGYLPNSVNLKLAAVKALVKYANDLGLCNFDLGAVKGLPPDVYRDTTGVNVESMTAILSAPGTNTLKGLRDSSILRLMWDCGLRRAEVTALTWEDFDAETGTLQVMGKGRVSKVNVYLSAKSVELLLSWRDIYPFTINENNPIFCSLDRQNKTAKAMTGKAIYKLVKHYSAKAGGKVISPHKIRHSAITAVLDATNGNVRQAQALSRHKNVNTLMKYDDNRKSESRKAVNLLSSLVE